MNGRQKVHLLVTILVWSLVVLAFLLLLAATITPPGFLLDPILLVFVLGPAGILILPAALLWYKGKEEQHPYL